MMNKGDENMFNIRQHKKFLLKLQSSERIKNYSYKQRTHFHNNRDI